MHDRLSSLKFHRKMRNISFALSVIFVFLGLAMIINSLVMSQDYYSGSIFFFALATVGAFIALYAHARFRSKD